MSDLFESASTSSAGYRLHKLEVYNWGTFDSSQGGVHTVYPMGATALLIGQNGCGKSTLVDALLTLLVRPVVRNYNVAAGAHKTERDERTYIKGAYGRLGRDDDQRAEVQYLRPDGKQYTAILASFKNNEDQAFTVAQVLHVNGEGQAEKLYCFSQGERSVAEGLSKLSSERLKSQLEKRGFKVAGSYTEYFSWFQKQTGVRQRAMDMFNQTVAVKDVQSLNRFIRDHMLEPSKWNEKIDALQDHFRQLSEAHRNLVLVRDQQKLLIPVRENGEAFKKKAEDVAKMERLSAACETFFRFQAVRLLGPACEQRRNELAEHEETRRGIEAETEENAERIRGLKNEIESAGGARLKAIPLLIKHEELQAEQKRSTYARYQSASQALGFKTRVVDDASFLSVLKELPTITSSIARGKEAADTRYQEVILKRAGVNQDMTELRRELTGLEQRHGNLPENLAELRRQMCGDLRLPERDVPFVSELVAVQTEEREWEASIEMILRSFALSLLVPEGHYRLVSAYVDQNRLRDARGRGQRLIYLKVGLRGANPHRPLPGSQSLLRKLTYREGHQLVPWVKGELEDRFDYLCCNTVEEFQNHQGSALTRQRHVKSRGNRHEKDDRDNAAHPSRFVLGWDNLEKRRHITAALAELGKQFAALDADVEGIKKQIRIMDGRQLLVTEAERVKKFEEIDFGRHEREIEALKAEKKSLEENNAAIRVLKSRLTAAEGRDGELRAARDRVMEKEYGLKQAIAQGQKLLENAERMLIEREASGDLALHRECFPEFEATLGETTLTADNIFETEIALSRSLMGNLDSARKELQPLQAELTAAMLKFLKAFDEEQADLKPSPEYLESFCRRLEQIERDDLPQYEKRFKDRLNEKVTQEISLLHGALQTEKSEIEMKIELLNQSLRQLEYRPGTFMRLEPMPVRDAEIAGFQEQLRECLANTFEGTFEADEARYIKIEKFLTRLQEEERWREKVTDVRKWFNFAARELDRATNAVRGYYQDSSGQSGGEKAKLAFTILVAAIAYQYDIDPSRSQCDRFKFVVVDEMFSKVDDQHAEYALNLFKQFGLQVLIVAPLDAKARVTEPYVGCYLHVVKDLATSKSQIYSMTAAEFGETMEGSTPVVARTAE